MAELDKATIERMLKHAEAQGFSAAELAALQEALYMRAANLTGEQRQKVSIATLDPDTRADVESFGEFFGTMSATITQRGKAGLDALTDDEWQQLIGADEND